MVDQALLTIHRINMILKNQKNPDVFAVAVPGMVCAVLEECRDLIAELATRPAFEAKEKVDG